MHDQQKNGALKEQAELLNRIGVQLSIIAEGKDSRLNNILKHLREALRNGSDPTKLTQTADVLFKYVMLDDNDKKTTDSAPIGYPLATATKELLAAINLSARAKAQLKTLCKQLESAEDFPGAIVLIKQIVAKVRSADAVVSEVADQGSAFKRMFAKKNKGEVAAEQQLEAFVASLKELLAELLDHMEVLNEDQARAVEFKEALRAADNIEQLEGILHEVLEMLASLTKEVKQEREQTEEFLNQLRENLHSVEGGISNAVANEITVLERAEQLGSKVGAEIGGIEEAVREDGDLQKLKDSVGGHISTINKQLIEHIQQEQKYHEETKNKVKVLSRKVREIENESEELRLQVRTKQQQAMKDVLTGIYNRAAYEERVVEEISRSERNGKPLSLIVIDCDKFKNINDNFGHKAGDLVLKKVAEIMKSRARASDFIARYGGDEFIILLPDTDGDGAKVFAEGVRKKVASAGFNDGGKPLKITISSGLTVLKDNDSPESAFERADKAMYQAKNSGRNEVGIL